MYAPLEHIPVCLAEKFSICIVPRSANGDKSAEISCICLSWNDVDAHKTKI